MSRETSYVLCVGDEAWCLLYQVEGTRSKSGERQTLLGAALVRVDSVDGADYDLTVIGASPRWYEGRRITKPRAALYAKGSRLERREFGVLIKRFWPSAADRIVEQQRAGRTP